MKLLNGIYQDANSVDQPEGTTFFVKNAVSNTKYGALNNENGFKFSAINDKVALSIGSKIPLHFIPIGIISMMDEIVVFSTDNTNSEIGLYNVKTDSYQTKINSQELAFNTSYPVEGAWNVNFEGDVIIGWTDFNKSPRVLNLNKIPSPFTTSKIDIFKELQTVNLLQYEVLDSGSFSGSGAFYPYYRYSNYSGDTTAWIPLPYIIFTDGNNKSIKLTFNNIDTTYDLFEVAFYYRIGNPYTTNTNNDPNFVSKPIYYERIFKQLQITSNSTIITTITGSETFIELIQGELLIPTLDYKTAFTVTELSKQFALGNLKSQEALKYQKYACNIKLKWYSEVVDYTAFSSKLEDKGFQHDEIYAFYIRFKLLNGNYSEAFHIPAPALSNFDSIVGNTNTYEMGAKNYQINDYSVITNTTNTNNCKGTFSYWENVDEQYPKENLPNPNDEEFNGAFKYDGSTPIPGGRNLLTEPCVNGTIGKVKHFKFPNLQTTWQYYKDKGISQYGLSKLDRLGIIVDTDSIFIPDEIKSQIQGYEIFYAERSLDNTTILAQDYSLLSAENFEILIDYGRYSTGCNFGTLLNVLGVFDNILQVRPNVLRNHAFDLLVNNNGGDHLFPAIFPTHVKFNFNLISKNPVEIITDTDFGYSYDGDSFSFGTTTLNGVSNIKYTNNDYCKKISKAGYLGNNTIQTINYSIDNRLQESCYHIQLTENVPFYDFVKDIYIDLSTNTGTTYAWDYDTETNTQNHTSALYNLFVLKNNIYERFTQQNLVNTGTTFTNETGEITIYGGDTFLSKCCSNNYGVTSDSVFNDNGLRGLKCWHWYIAETRNNNNKRENSIIIGDATNNSNYQAYYDLTNFINLSIAGVENDGLSSVVDYKYKYNPNFSATLNKFIGTIFNPNNRFSNNFPNRIIRSLPQGNDTKRLAWMDFKANDYFDVRRNRGEIIALRQTSEGRLFIQCVQALFITNNKTTLSTTEVQLKLGSGDIFDIEPFEIIYNKDGYIGSQHRESCYSSKLGYSCVDSLQGKIFLINGDGSEPKEISGQGLKNFFLEYIRTIPNNLNYQGISKIFTCYDFYYNRLLISIKNGEESFTLSYSPELNQGNGAWLSFHDYICDILCNTRHNVISFKNDFTTESNLYIHNIGDKKGVYYKEALTDVIKPFIIIPVFNFINNQPSSRYLEKLFQSIHWKSEVKNTISKYLETFSSISIWNDYQCSGEINLDFSPELGEGNIRKVKEYWLFNDFRDILIHNNVSPNDFSVFIKSLFEDYNIINSTIDITMDDFEQKRFNSTHILARLKYNNLTNSEISIIDIGANENLAIR